MILFIGRIIRQNEVIALWQELKITPGISKVYHPNVCNYYVHILKCRFCFAYQISRKNFNFTLINISHIKISLTATTTTNNTVYQPFTQCYNCVADHQTLAFRPLYSSSTAAFYTFLSEQPSPLHTQSNSNQMKYKNVYGSKFTILSVSMNVCYSIKLTRASSNLTSIICTRTQAHKWEHLVRTRN